MSIHVLKRCSTEGCGATGKLTDGFCSTCLFSNKQFEQARASGHLQGDELRAILEHDPLLSSKIATQVGVPVAWLEELGKQGALTFLNGVLVIAPQEKPE